LVLCSFIVNLAFLTRYQTAPLIAAGMFALLFWNKATGKIKLRDAILFALLSSAIPLLWFLRNMLVTGHATSANPGFHQIFYDQLNSALYVVSLWLVPENVPSMIKKIALAILVIAI